MPYIPKELRGELDDYLDALVEHIHSTSEDSYDGQLNYVISQLVTRVMKPSTGWKYRVIARCVAVFECAKLEFYRRIAEPYENKAMEDNGDINGYK